ncbi:hypothetical protein DFA_12020 [Cavenderia fasciculata]|uniref:Ankyrin repeat-containing protein n=1 Tax=Cavenderia fasciculata TaxID=261658 RepID=F4QFE9_CACFS|nr:uncharacterized protein DFA_12020 [Cavenderia fasciculata]EGG14250.1 hypothetical protein DFA_12020 [Cavenderia fasciculata]|eukprot:XP_004350959.1 hypothetical protein DFA_12020 [Cavenderia fasciculata]
MSSTIVKSPLTLVLHNIVTLRCIIQHVYLIHIKLLQERDYANNDAIDEANQDTVLPSSSRKSHLLLNPSAAMVPSRAGNGQVYDIMTSSNIHRTFRYKDIKRVEWMVDHGYISLLIDKIVRKETLTFTERAVERLCSFGLPLDQFKIIFNAHRREFGDVSQCYFFASTGPNCNLPVLLFLQAQVPETNPLAAQFTTVTIDLKDSFKLSPGPVQKRTKDIHYDALMNSIQVHLYKPTKYPDEPQHDIITAITPFVSPNRVVKVLSNYASFIKSKDTLGHLMTTFASFDIVYLLDELYFLHGDDYELFRKLESMSPVNPKQDQTALFSRYRHRDTDIINKDRVRSLDFILQALKKENTEPIIKYEVVYESISGAISDESLRWEAVYLEMVTFIYGNHSVIESLIQRSLKLAIQNQEYWNYLFYLYKPLPTSLIDELLKCGDMVTLDHVIAVREKGFLATEFALNHCNRVDIMKYLMQEFDLSVLPFAIALQIGNNNMELVDYSLGRISESSRKGLSIPISKAIAMDNYPVFEKMILLYTGEKKLEFECNTQRELEFLTKHFVDVYNQVTLKEPTIIKIFAHAGYTGNISTVMRIHAMHPEPFYSPSIFDKVVIGGHPETLEYLLENRKEGFSSTCWRIVGRIGSIHLYKTLCQHSMISHSYEMIKEAYVFGHTDFILNLIMEGAHQLNVLYLKHSIEENHVELLEYYLQRKLGKLKEAEEKRDPKTKKVKKFRRILNIMESQTHRFVSDNLIDCLVKYVPAEVINATDHDKLKSLLRSLGKLNPKEKSCIIM